MFAKFHSSKALASVFCLLGFFLLAFSVHSAHAAQADSGTTKSPIVEVFQFDKTPLSEILRLISEMTGQNVVATPEIQALPISLYLKNVTPILALEVICKTYNLWFSEQDNVIRVMRVEEYGRELTLRRDEQTRVYNLKYASCFTVAEAISNVFGSRVRLTTPEDVKSYGHVGTDEFPDIGTEEDSKIDDSTDTDDTFEKKEKGVTNLAGLKMDEVDLGRMARLLREGGEFTPEMLLERQIGQARALMTLFPRNNSIIVRSVDSSLLGEVGDLIDQIDTPTRELLLEVKILGVTLEDGMESFFDLDYTPDVGTNAALSLASQQGSLTSAPASFAFSYISEKIGMRLSMLESEGRITELSTPLMLVANNAAGKFFQGVEVPIREGYTVTQAQFNADGAQTSPASVSTTYRREDVGFTLEIAPSINADRTVTMKILTEMSRAGIGQGPSFDYVIGTQVRSGETDTVITTEIEDIVVGMDGKTIILGGLIEESIVDDEEKVPFLGDIPILGFFFSNKVRTATRKELVMLITPHIIMTPHEAQKIRENLLPEYSNHPYATQGKENILQLQEKTGILQPSFEGELAKTPFPFNVGHALRELIDGNRTRGAIVEIGE